MGINTSKGVLHGKTSSEGLILHKQFALEDADKSWTHTKSELHLELSFVHSAMNPNKHWTLKCLSEIKGKFVHYLQGLVPSDAPTWLPQPGSI